MLIEITDFRNIQIGDTPTIGAGFWAEEWDRPSHEQITRKLQNLPVQIPTALSGFTDGLRNILGDCIPNFSGYQKVPSMQELRLAKLDDLSTIRAVAMSGSSPCIHEVDRAFYTIPQGI